MAGKKRGIRKWFWNGSMVAALIAALAVFAVMLQLEKRALVDYEKAPIYIAAKEIPKGQVITVENYQEYFEECMLDKKCIPPTAISQVGQIEGLVAEIVIQKGTFLTEGMFETLDAVTALMQEPVIVGLKAEDLYQVVGGVLRVGDKIHIFKVDEKGEATLLWENVFVQGVFDQAGIAVENDDTTTGVQRINVYLDKSQVSEFYGELSSGMFCVAKAEE